MQILQYQEDIFDFAKYRSAKVNTVVKALRKLKPYSNKSVDLPLKPKNFLGRFEPEAQKKTEP